MEKLKRSFGKYRYQRLASNAATSGLFSSIFVRTIFCCAFIFVTIYCLWTFLVIKPEKSEDNERAMFLLNENGLMEKDERKLQKQLPFRMGNEIWLKLDPGKKKFYIQTETCEIPYVNPFEERAMQMLHSQDVEGCYNRLPEVPKEIVQLVYNKRKEQYQLHIKYPEFDEKNNSIMSIVNVSCCYKEIGWKRGDASYNSEKCKVFEQDFVVPIDIEFMIVYCDVYVEGQEEEFEQNQVFSMVQKRKPGLAKKKKPPKGKRWPSIIILGIDTMSRINFPRVMPRTYSFIKDDWLELQGYTKVGENTFPNVMAMLTGYEDAYELCQPKVNFLDNCNLLWTKFQENGYYTGYGEDLRHLSTFNYIKKGFNNAPTDFYQRPLIMAIEDKLHISERYSIPFCAGNRYYGEYIFDYALEFATRLKDEPHFGIFWTNSFSHNHFSTAALMDNNTLGYLTEFERLGILKNSIVMLISDHGCRWGPLLKLPSSHYEGRLPMFFISIPSWFRKQYPDLVQNLEINARRLTSPYDMHLTLQHLLKLANHNYNIQPAEGCPHCVSLLETVPANRTCWLAGIPRTWCCCTEPEKYAAPSKEFGEELANLVISEINEFCSTNELKKLCHRLKLKEVTNTVTQHRSEENEKVITYIVTFTTSPRTSPETVFSSVVDYNEDKAELVDFSIEDVSRQSSYKNTIKCLSDKHSEAFRYCICKNSKKKA